MQKLKVDLDLKDGENYIDVSDRSPVSFLFFVFGLKSLFLYVVV